VDHATSNRPGPGLGSILHATVLNTAGVKFSMRIVYAFSFFLGLWAVAVLLASSCPAQDTHRKETSAILRLNLKPRWDALGQVEGIRVSYELAALPELPGAPVFLHFDTLQPALRRTRDQVTDLIAEDAAGPVSFRLPVEQKQGDALNQVWQTTRPVQGPFRVSYFVPVAEPITNKRGPHIDLQAAGNGVSGAFVSFLLAPPLEGTLELHVHWDLPAGQTAVSSYALGDFNRRITLSALRTTLFLAGPLETYPSPLPHGGISFYALGLSSEELAHLAGWASKAYDAERAAFHGATAEPFRFLVRSYAGGPITSGRADLGTFMLYMPAGVKPDLLALHSMIAHETVHALIKDLDDAQGDEGDWYTEGTADYFAIVLPHKARLFDSCEYVTIINEEAALYYTNALRNVPNQDLTKIMWSGRNAWAVPYARGALYFADLDAKLKQRHAHVDVLDLVNETSRRIRLGAPANNQTWRDVLARRAGKWAVSDWTLMLQGRLMLPVDAFGKAVKSVPISGGFFDLGFAKPERLNAGSKVEQVQAGSPAARAGLRDGDTFTQSLDLNPFYRSFGEPITLYVLHDNVPESITYDPHLGSHPEMKWTLSLRQGPLSSCREASASHTQPKNL